MRLIWKLGGLVALTGCTAQPAMHDSARAEASPRGPSSLDYVVYASLGDTDRPLSLATSPIEGPADAIGGPRGALATPAYSGLD